MTIDDDVIKNLFSMDDDRFTKLVSSNLRSDKQPRLWRHLLHPRVVARTHSVLTQLLMDVQGQQAERRAAIRASKHEASADGSRRSMSLFYAAQAEHEQWASRSLSYKRLVDSRLQAAKRSLAAARSTKDESVTERRVRQLDTVFRLAWAIRRHRESCDAEGIEAEPHDHALWACLDELLVETTEDGVMPVRRFLEGIASKPGFAPPAD